MLAMHQTASRHIQLQHRHVIITSTALNDCADCTALQCAAKFNAYCINYSMNAL